MLCTSLLLSVCRGQMKQMALMFGASELMAHCHSSHCSSGSVGGEWGPMRRAPAWLAVLSPRAGAGLGVRKRFCTFQVGWGTRLPELTVLVHHSQTWVWFGCCCMEPGLDSVVPVGPSQLGMVCGSVFCGSLPPG